MFLGYNFQIMLKRWASKYWPMVVLLILIGAILGMSRYAEHRKGENPQNAQSSSPQAPVSPRDAGKSTENTDKAKHRPDFIDTFTWPEGATVWALFLTLIVIAWQSAETRTASLSMALSTKASIEFQRARMKIEVVATNYVSTTKNRWDYGLSAKNIGQSVAYIVEIWEKTDHLKLADVVHENFPPPERRPYSERDAVFPGESSGIGSTSDDFICPLHLKHLIEGGQVGFMWYGWIRYRDLVGTLHRRRYFYAYSWAAKRFVEFGPAGYNAEDDG